MALAGQLGVQTVDEGAETGEEEDRQLVAGSPPRGFSLPFFDNLVYFSLVNHVVDFRGTGMFVAHTVESAPEASRAAMAGVTHAFGMLPDAVARLAESPELLTGFLELSQKFELTTLEPLARETVVMTVAVRNGCDVCVKLHTARLRKLGADPDLVDALRDGREVPEAHAPLEAVRQFALRVIEHAGGVDDVGVQAFLDQGYTERNALEVVMGIGTYTLSTLANRLTGAAA